MKKLPTYTFDIARVWYFAVLICMALFLPWWVTFIFALYILFHYAAYEVIVAGVLIDALYGGGSEYWGTPFFATILFTTIAVIAPHAKRGIIFYP